MTSISEQVEIVHKIIIETLMSCGTGLSPDFAGLLTTAIGERVPSTDRPPWLTLPVFTCEALEGDPGQAHHIAAALEIGRIAAGCLDEWQDQDTDDALWKEIGPGQTVNLATAMIGLSQLSLVRLVDLGAEPALVVRLQQEFSLTLLQMCAGQHADLSDDLSLGDYEAVAGAKSGSLLRLGCRAGAMVAGASPETVGCYGEFGYHLGILAQAWNDLWGLGGAKGKEDTGHSRTLPILAALAMDGTRDGPDSAEGRAGQLYALVQIQALHERAAEGLARCRVPGRLGLFLDAYAPSRLLPQEGALTRSDGEDDGDR